MLLEGVPGVEPGRWLSSEAETVGANAAKMAVGTGASVTILDIDLNRLATSMISLGIGSIW